MERGRSIPAGYLRFIPVASNQFPVLFRWKTAENSLEKIQRIPLGILRPRSSNFRSFPVGYGDFPASFPTGSDRFLEPESSTWVLSLCHIKGRSLFDKYLPSTLYGVENLFLEIFIRKDVHRSIQRVLNLFYI